MHGPAPFSILMYFLELSIQDKVVINGCMGKCKRHERNAMKETLLPFVLGCRHRISRLHWPTADLNCFADFYLQMEFKAVPIFESYSCLTWLRIYFVLLDDLEFFHFCGWCQKSGERSAGTLGCPVPLEDWDFPTIELLFCSWIQMLISSYMKCKSIVYFRSTVIRDVSFVLSIVVVVFSIMFLCSPLLLMRFVFFLIGSSCARLWSWGSFVEHIDLWLVDGLWGERRVELSISSILFSLLSRFLSLGGDITPFLSDLHCSLICLTWRSSSRFHLLRYFWGGNDNSTDEARATVDFSLWYSVGFCS